MKKKHQNPSALCVSQVNRARRDPQVTLKLRRQFFSPGHHSYCYTNRRYANCADAVHETTLLSERQVLVKVCEPLYGEPPR